MTFLTALLESSWALNSAVECHLHTVEVIGSNPIAPTKFLEIHWCRKFFSRLAGFEQAASMLTPPMGIEFESLSPARRFHV
jgi:hypothetical protein